MLKDVSHSSGVSDTDEILFSTAFGYMFPDAAKSSDCLLPASPQTEVSLLALGAAMGEPGTAPAQDSSIPSGFTYLGQFIDHDVTARTDRESAFSRIATATGAPLPITPRDPDAIVTNLRNGRRPQLDLDSVYGDGPRLIPLDGGNATPGSVTEADELYDSATGKLRHETLMAGAIDLPRDGRKARIADMRNDENLNISQLHAAFLAFHNKIVDRVPGPADPAWRYAKARQIVRWSYQYIVARDYLARVCDTGIINDILRNGPRFYRPGVEDIYMPLEFATAGFRFGHSMVRGSYTLQSGTERTISQLLGVSREHDNPADDLLEPVGANHRVKADHTIHWGNFFEIGGATPQMARTIDTRLAEGLFDLPFEEGAPMGAMLRHLAQRNLLRGYLLSIPTGQAAAAATGVIPISAADMTAGEHPDIVAALNGGGLSNRTPLWYYVLREASVQKQGQSLGHVGSTIVGETLIGMLKHDPTSYLNNQHHGRVRSNGIKVPHRPDPISSLAEMIEYTELLT